VRFTPGEKFEYSNPGYVVLGQIIERLSGMRYAEFLMWNIFDPLGMHATLVVDERRQVRREAIDKTGLTGLFDFNLDVTVPPPDAPDDPGAFDATIAAPQKLGLRLEPIKSTDEFVVIDHIRGKTGSYACGSRSFRRQFQRGYGGSHPQRRPFAQSGMD
jgi:hypothetical protein